MQLNLFFFLFCSRLEGLIQPEGLKILLEFTLARGNLKSIFRVLKLLYGKRFILVSCTPF